MAVSSFHISVPPMAFHYSFFLVLLSLSLLDSSQAAATYNQSQFFTLMKKSLKGDPLSDWDATGEKPFCNYTGIGCNEQGYVVKVDVSRWRLVGRFPEDVCSYLPKLRFLGLSYNSIHGNFPSSITNCSLLEELNMRSTNLTGTLPDFSSMTSLRLLDLSWNSFVGDFPISVTNLTNLKELYFNDNKGFNLWRLSDDFCKLRKLRVMSLGSCGVQGSIPESIGNMTSLTDLEMYGNLLVGQIPAKLGSLKNLRLLELYYNHLDGVIPEELGNLTALTDFDMSGNKLTGKIPECIFRLPKLRALQLYNNSLTGEIPPFFANSTTLTILSLYENMLTGEVPRGLGGSSPMILLELSENQLSGELPPEACNGRKLRYYLVMENMFSGKVPESYSRCKSLLRFRVSYNNLEGPIPEGLLALPHASIIDLAYNHLNGSISKTIGLAKNLSELFIQSNGISGVLPPEISKAANLVKMDLSNNLLSSPIPSELGNLRKLTLLALQGNRFNSSIPDSLSSLKSLNVLDLSNNILTGNIPESLCDLLPNSMNFSNNLLSGPIPISLIKGGLVESFSGNPSLCVPVDSSDTSFPTCSQSHNQKKINHIWVICISVGMVIVGIVLFLKRWFNKESLRMENEETLSSSFSSYDVKSFHRISFDHREIIEAMVDKNIVGHGGFGTVYRIELSNGEIVAVKKLWCHKSKDSASEDQLILDKELKTEVDTLGGVRHKNIVNLYSYFSRLDSSLLVYEYMPNGNLWDALHKGKILLDWPTRHQIALGVARGLAYLHHDLNPSIIHRDIKSTNILLDVNYQPKVADFGIAKVLQARGKDSTSTVVAGTYGYLAPEYAYSSKATTKCDVYSFGVVLMELITGKKPVEPEYGESKNIICWVSTKVETKEGAMEVLDRQVSGLFKDEMIKVLKIAIRSTYRTPGNRPTMKEVVQLLIEADPCRFKTCKLSTKTIEMASLTKPKNPYDF